MTDRPAVPTNSASSEPESETIVHTDGAVMVMTINRPDARNALTRAVSQRIAEALDELDDRDDLAVGIITGAGGTFCAGMDLKAFLRGERPSIPGRGLCGMTMTPPAKPLIAAVEGYALAGGCELVLACDMVVASHGARFGLPEVKRGLIAAAGGLMRLPERVPANVAMELVLTGDFLTATRAAELGLVNRLVGEGDALFGALELAHSVAANGPLATRASKRVMVESRTWLASERWDQQQLILDPVLTSDDAREGARAFAEKRDPQWTAR